MASAKEVARKQMSTSGPYTRLTKRLQKLLEALRDGPLTRSALLARLEYRPGDSGRRVLDRDLKHLATLGIVVERSGRPRLYTLRGGLPVFTKEEIRTLALIRDTFDARHPQATRIAALLERLTGGLTEQERRMYKQHVVRSAPIRPAIDYSPYAEVIEKLEHAIAVRQPVSFCYRSASGKSKHYPWVEPSDIEFYDRHFYFVGLPRGKEQMYDFRIDRISELVGLDQRLPPGTERKRPLITFRYRLAAMLAQGGISERFENQRVIERLPNGDVIIEAQGRSEFFVIQTLLRYRANAELLEPAELRARMAREVRGLMELYADGEGA